MSTKASNSERKLEKTELGFLTAARAGASHMSKSVAYAVFALHRNLIRFIKIAGKFKSSSCCSGQKVITGNGTLLASCLNVWTVTITGDSPKLIKEMTQLTPAQVIVR